MQATTVRYRYAYYPKCNALQCLGSILRYANSFSMLWVRAALDIRLDGTVMHYKL